MNNQFSSTLAKDEINFNGLDKKAIKEMIREAEREKKSIMTRLKFLNSRLKNLKNCLGGKRKISNETREEVSFTPRNRENPAWKLGKSRSLRDLESSKPNFSGENPKKRMKKFEKMNEEMNEINGKLDEGKLKAVNSIVSPTRIPKHETKKRVKDKNMVEEEVPDSPVLKNIAVQSTGFQLEEDDVVYAQKLVAKWEKMKKGKNQEKKKDFSHENRMIKDLTSPHELREMINIGLINSGYQEFTPSDFQVKHRRPQLRQKKAQIPRKRRHQRVVAQNFPSNIRSRSYNVPTSEYPYSDDIDQLKGSYLLEYYPTSSSRGHSRRQKKRKIFIRNQKKKNIKQKGRNKNFNFRTHSQTFSPNKKQKNLRIGTRRKLRGASSLKPSIYFN